MSYAVPVIQATELFQNGNALVRTGTLKGTIIQFESLTRTPGIYSGRHVSTSLAPTNGQMAFYKTRNEHSPFALIFDARECLRKVNKTIRSPDYWCFPTGYYAKIEHNSNSRGIPTKNVSPYAAKGTRSVFDVGHMHSLESLKASNEKFVQEGSTPLYNEVYTKVMNPKAIAVISQSPYLHCQGYIEKINQLYLSKDVPLLIFGPELELYHYTHERFFSDFSGLPTKSIVRLLNSLTESSMRNLHKYFFEYAFNHGLIFTQFYLRDRPSLIPGDINAAEKMASFMLLTDRFETDPFNELIHLYPSLLSREYMQNILKDKTLSLNTNLLLKVFIAMSLHHFNDLKNQAVLTLFQEHKTKNLYCTTPIFRRTRLRKWIQLERNLQNSHLFNALMHELAENIHSSTGRRAFIYEALGIPEHISLDVLQDAARRYILRQHAAPQGYNLFEKQANTLHSPQTN